MPTFSAASYSWIVDRFHLSTKLYQLEVHGRDYDFRWLEDRPVGLGFRLVFCCRSPDSFGSARAERIKVSGKPSQYDDLGQFVREQEEMQGLIERSVIPTMMLDVSNNEVGAAVAKIADWLEMTGGLYVQ